MDLVHDCLWVCRTGHDDPVSSLHDFTISLKGSMAELLLSPFSLPVASPIRLSQCFLCMSLFSLSGLSWLKNNFFLKRLSFQLGQWAAMTYPAATWGPDPSAAMLWDCTLGLPHSAIAGDWISVHGPGEFPYDSGWDFSTKWGCTPGIVPIGRGFSVPVASVQPCCEVCSISSFNNI